jgi:hypothetical protein
MARLKLIFHIIIHLILLVVSSVCIPLAKGFNHANIGLDRLLKLNETHTDGLTGG